MATAGHSGHTPAIERTPQRCIRARFVVTDGYEGDSQLLTLFTTKCRSDPTYRSSAAPAPASALSIAWSVPERRGRR